MLTGAEDAVYAGDIGTGLAALPCCLHMPTRWHLLILGTAVDIMKMYLLVQGNPSVQKTGGALCT